MEQYLIPSRYIDWEDPDILKKAKTLSAACSSEEEVAHACFRFVRDHIKHSNDYRLNPVTVRASDVLRHETGFCYSKSHLLAALLRANSIPAGLCYQRLTIDGNRPPFCLHGLNAVYIEPYGWYRIDPRGNKVGVKAEFHPPREQLAFPVINSGERDLEGIWPEPLGIVIDVLENLDTYDAVADNLPDIEMIRR